jgi:hypothetical protein
VIGNDADMSKTRPERGAPVKEHPPLAIRLLLAAIGVGVLVRPAVLIWAEHVNSRFAEEPMYTVFYLTLWLPLVLVPISVAAAMVAGSWQRPEKAVLVSLVPTLILQMWIAPSGFGCAAVAGIPEACGLDRMSFVQEIAIVFVSLLVVAMLIWLGRRQGRGNVNRER